MTYNFNIRLLIICMNKIARKESTVTSIRSSPETKKAIKSMDFGEATKFLKKQTIQHINQKAITMPNVRWVSIPFQEYNLLLGGNSHNDSGEFVPIYVKNANHIINFCYLWKKRIMKNNELCNFKFKDVYHVVEYFHKMNHLDISLIQNIGSIRILSKHTIGTNYSKMLIELFTQTGKITQEFKIMNYEIRDSTINTVETGFLPKLPGDDLDGVTIDIKFNDQINF